MRDEIGAPVVDRSQVELEVTRVQDHALRRVERGRERVGHRVSDGDELEIERPHLAAFAVRDGDELGATEQSGLLDAAPREPEREGGAVDRERHITQQEREPADVIFVTVRRDAAVDAVARSP